MVPNTDLRFRVWGYTILWGIVFHTQNIMSLGSTTGLSRISPKRPIGPYWGPLLLTLDSGYRVHELLWFLLSIRGTRG